MLSTRLIVSALVLWLGLVPAVAQEIPHPTDFFGFEIGTDGMLAGYPEIVDYLRLLAQRSDRIAFEERGTTTLGNPYVLATISSAENLARMDRLVEINHRLNDPRGLSEADAMALAREAVPFYFLYATIHSLEVGNTQTIVRIAHRLATERSPEIAELLDNVVLLLVPSQNPDGQVLVVDHWYATQDTDYDRTYPDLYHHYTGHDDNRDWFMFTQKETRLALDIHRELKPQVTHDMHQMGTTGARIFVPPFKDPHDPNIHPLLIGEQGQIGLAMAAALIAEGKGGVVYGEQYDQWAPARQYMVYHGQPRILTEIASARLADPFSNPVGPEVPLGAQEVRVNFPLPYDRGVWRLGDIVDYGFTVVFAALEQVARNRTTWMENYYRVHRDWVDRDEAPYAFVVSADQRDPFETYELLDLLHLGEVEIHQARAPFTAGDERYPAGSWVIQLAQPAGAFAKTMLETQVYPDLRSTPGGPPIPPYDVTTQTLGMLMGVDVDQIDEPVLADLVLLDEIIPQRTPMPLAPGWGYLVGPASNAGFLAATRLQQAGVPVYRAAEAFERSGQTYEPGTWLVPPSSQTAAILESVSRETGLVVDGTNDAPDVTGFRMHASTRVGLWRTPNNPPGGWMRWLFEQYELGYIEISSLDFAGDLSDKYDVIVLPAGTTRNRIVLGLDQQRHDETWRWAYGVGEDGWNKLAQWVWDGGTLVALGNAVGTARALLDLPIESVLPGRGGSRATLPPLRRQLPSRLTETGRLREIFQSPAQLLATLRDRIVDPTSVFYGPGSMLKQEFNPHHPVAFGMPKRWPVFFRFDQAYRLTPSFEITAEAVSRYPDEADMVASGWLLGDDLLRTQANVVAFTVGEGSVVTLGSQVTFRAQTRGTFKLLFNAIFQGPAEAVSAAELARLN